ncbi:MAG: SpoVA/SpoVAEb family sporulation membrane protein [Ruminococcaceae bacterium]|nr:SpoVA/SpoVAEb family sporulation membrane protein [Oscillospiraceae bacterium]
MSINNNIPAIIQKMGPNLTSSEGFILGVGAKMFTIAGPFIVYGTLASVMYGLIYWICQMLK